MTYKSFIFIVFEGANPRLISVHLTSTDKTIKIPLDIFDDYWASVHYTEIK